MQFLITLFRFLLSSSLICCLPIVVGAEENESTFTPVYTNSEDNRSSLMEIKSLTIEIQNMPRVKTQDDLGECGAFALSTLIQKFNCDTWPAYVGNCKNPNPDFDISSFGMMIYTHATPNERASLLLNVEKTPSLYEVLKNVSVKNSFIRESCKPFYQLVNSFSKNVESVSKKDQFFKYLEKLYEEKKFATEASFKDCPECLDRISASTGMNQSFIDLKAALSKKSYNKFLYSLFFEKCPLIPFAAGYVPEAFPPDSMNVSASQMKDKIVTILKDNKPVLISTLCVSPNDTSNCKTTHSLVVTGYKRVCQSDGKNCRDVFKVQNSWGEEWQARNNNGWVDADKIVDNLKTQGVGTQKRIDSQSILWLKY